MTFRSKIQGFIFTKPCQVIGLSGCIKYSFVWAFDDVMKFGIHEYTTGFLMGYGHTIEHALKMAATKVSELERIYTGMTKINSMADYGYSRK